MRDNVSPAWRFGKKSFCTAVFLVALCCGQMAQAAPAKEVIDAIEHQNWRTAKRLIEGSPDQILKDIYVWRKMQDPHQKISFVTRMKFVRQYPHWPQNVNFKNAMEGSISQQDPQDLVLQWFDENPPSTVQGVFFYAEALLRTNQRQKFKAFINDWWARTLLPRADQKYIYARFKSHITPEAHKKRFDKLLFNKQYTNARAIARVLRGGYVELAEARIGLAENKYGVNRLIDWVPKSLQKDSGLLYERLKWRRKHDLDKGAIDILNHAPPYEQLANPKGWWQERHIMIRRLLEKAKYKQAYKLASHHVQKDGFAYAQAQWLSGWLALRFLDNPTAALPYFENMAKKVSMPVSLARAYYWAGLAASKSGKIDLALSHFTQAAKFQTIYYGQRASHYVNAPAVQSLLRSPIIFASEKQHYAQDPLMKAANVYSQAGYNEAADSFVYAFVQKYDEPKAQSYAIENAERMRLYDTVVRLSKAASQKGWFVSERSYPVVPSMTAYAHPQVPKSLLYAVMRQESQFNPDARSPVGARGLMQLMPATAKHTARRYKIKHYTSWLTSKPEHNVQVGSYYLHELLDSFDGNTVFAIAAYNAGPSRVRSWLKQLPDPRVGAISYEDWIELIPIYETRNYVQRVWEGMQVYQMILGERNQTSVVGL